MRALGFEEVRERLERANYEVAYFQRPEPHTAALGIRLPEMAERETVERVLLALLGEPDAFETYWNDGTSEVEDPLLDVELYETG